MEEKKKKTVAEEANEIINLNQKIAALKDTISIARACTSSYAKISITASGTNWAYLEEIKALNTTDIEAIAKLIGGYLTEKLIPLEEEFNSYVISKKL